MKKLLVVVLVVTMLFSMVSVAMGAFEDSPKSTHWAYENFMLLYNAGLIKGYPDNTFKGNNYATRYEMVEMTARVLKFFESRIGEISEGGKVTPLDEAKAKELIAETIKESNVATKEDLKTQADEIYAKIQELEKEFQEELKQRDDVRVTTLEEKVKALESKVANIETVNADQDGKIETASKDAKTGKTLGVIGIILGIAGIAAAFLL